MPSSVRDFWSTLVRLRLVDAATAEQMARQLDAAGADDPVKVAKALIAQKWLTKFQAKRLLADRGDELVQGNFMVLDRAETTPLSRWFRAHPFESPSEYFIYPCSAAADSRSPIDFAWLQPHTMVYAAGLQSIHVVETAAANPAIGSPWRGLVVSELPLGKSLADWLASMGPIGFASAIALGEVVGGALAAMHAAGLFHGGLRPGRVWIADDSSVFLLRTASGPPIFPGDAVQPSYDWFDDDGQAAAFSAPEWLAGQSHADTRSDVYSLGALIYHVATGRTVTPGELPAEVAGAVAAGASGDPLLRVLGATLAASPDQRFQDVPSFLQALAAVQSMMASQPVVEQPIVQQSVVEQTLAAEPALPAVAAPPIEVEQPVAKPRPDAASAKKAEKPAATATAAPTATPTATSIATPTATSTATPTATSIATPTATSIATPKKTEKTEKTVSASPSQSPAKQPAAEKSAAVKSAPVAVMAIQTALPSDNAPPPVLESQEAAITKVAATATVPIEPTAAATATVAIAPANAAATAEKPDAAASPKPDAAPAKSTAEAEPPPRRVRKRNRRNQRGPIIIGSSAVGVLLLLVAIVMRSTGDSTPPERPRPTPRPVAVVTPTPSQNNAEAGGFDLVRDDKTLWAPPWPADSVAPPLDLIVPGAQAIVSLRPKSMLREGAEADWLGWFGQDLEPTLQQLSKRTGVQPRDIERLTIGLVAGVDGEPTGSIAVWLSQPTDLRSLRQKWGVSASKTQTGETIFAGDEPGSDAYFVPGEAITDATTVSSFVVGSLDTIRLIAEGGGGAIPLSRPLQTAWDQTSDSADIVAMVVPNFLFADGRKMLQRFAPRSIDPLKSLLIPNVSAAVLTIDTRQNWYGEVKLMPGGGTTAAGLAREIQNRVTGLPALAESFLVDSDISPTWRAMAIRLPQFLRAINDQSRYGVSATLATYNFYLPAAAAPQVTLASLLAMSTTPQVAAVVATTPTPTTLTVEQMLETNLSISFEQESLEFAVAMIGDEFSTGLPEGTPRPKITIIGGDLEKSGITQNQQVRNFKMSDAPLRDALTRLVAGANPDKTVTAMTEEKQSLVWVVDPASTDQNPSLLITTRPQAAVKGYKLPKEFVGE